MLDEYAKELIKQIKMQNKIFMRIADLKLAELDSTYIKKDFAKDWNVIETEIDAMDEKKEPQEPKKKPKVTDEYDWSFDESNVGVNK